MLKNKEFYLYKMMKQNLPRLYPTQLHPMRSFLVEMEGQKSETYKAWAWPTAVHRFLLGIDAAEGKKVPTEKKTLTVSVSYVGKEDKKLEKPAKKKSKKSQ